MQTGYHEPYPPPQGDCLSDVYSRIFFKYFEHKSLKKSSKVFEIFITLLCYGFHKKIARNMSLLKKFKSIYKSFYCLKALVIIVCVHISVIAPVHDMLEPNTHFEVIMHVIDVLAH